MNQQKIQPSGKQQTSNEFIEEPADQATESMPNNTQQKSKPKPKQKKPVQAEEEPTQKQQTQKKQPMGELPPVMMKRGGGGFDFDADILNEQKKNLHRLYAGNGEEEFQDPF